MSSESKSSFFRHSGWMVMATFIGGIFMAAVTPVALNVMEKSEYNDFIALLGFLMLFGTVPSSALQTIFAQQSAAALTDETKEDLTASVRALLRTTFIFWLAVAGLILVFARPVAAALTVKNPAALRVTMLAVLSVAWTPTFRGLLQGLHRFASLGWLLILEGVIRLATIILLVQWLKGGSAGGVWAVFCGQYLTLALAVWLTRDVWSATTRSVFLWKHWLIRGLPLTLGMGAFVFMSIRLDSLFAKSLLFNPSTLLLYNGAAFIGFAMIQFTAPIASVMFPTIVRHLALSKKSNALVITLAVTGGFAFLAAVASTLFPKLPLAILHIPMGAAPLVPWFVWAQIPLPVANVLIQNLLARGRFAATPWLILVPILYALTLISLGPGLLARTDDFSAFKTIIETMGFFCLLLFGVAAWFTWHQPANDAADRDSAGGR